MQISRKNSEYEAAGSYRYLPADTRKRCIISSVNDDDSGEPEVSYVQPVVGNGHGRGGLSITSGRSYSVNGNRLGIASQGWEDERRYHDGGRDRLGGAGDGSTSFPLGNQGHVRNPFDPLPRGFPGR